MTRMMIALLCTFTTTLSACGAEDATEEATPPAATAPAPAAAPAPPPEPTPAPAPAPTDGAMTVPALRDAFAADQATWLGREVTVRGAFVSATSVGGALNNLSLLADRDDDFMSSVVCAFGDDPPASVDYRQWEEVTVRGTVRERFRRPALEDCSIVE